MNFFGMGPYELLIVLAVALVVLGPGKTIGMARNVGKVFGEVRRAFTDLSRMAEEEERNINQEPPANRRTVDRRPPISEPAKDSEAEEER